MVVVRMVFCIGLELVVRLGLVFRLVVVVAGRAWGSLFVLVLVRLLLLGRLADWDMGLGLDRIRWV